MMESYNESSVPADLFTLPVNIAVMILLSQYLLSFLFPSLSFPPLPPPPLSHVRGGYMVEVFAK